MADVKTFGIKLSEIRPCDNCGGKLVPVFNVVEIRMAAFNQQNVNSVLGLNQMFGGRAIGLAEVMAPGADNAINVLDEAAATVRLFVCQECYAMKDLNLAVLAERCRPSAAEKR